ncbi:3'(2'),5'-bisphosphate nucleotidase CysQ [Phaeodactylibacter luteus]|uniref:3'(2'),5'-bisphosphate nucleotidase CysQ n=1 Tax=Phaeodactylibacter luteus TaxID=1564516 RepID=A0A5C6S047_9BACT|nr:3'(2'),5'-bisphosphate nucleotidase CysQ [Phaeodactylibacter luteus]TXB67625.1 3'(2'),5'-bisphosphate nucleotidase CysQ [Phaeodactylibacter luteus]
MTHQELAQEVAQIARRAGAAIMAVYSKEDVGVELKADESPLTLADQAANEVICRALEALPVQYPIISEENKAIPYETRKSFGRHWLVDPLDGTKEFIKRNGEFTVNIALVDQGRPVIGVVYVPCLNELYWSVAGDGAYLEYNGEQRKLQAPAFKLADEGLRVVCSRSHLNEATQAFVDALAKPELVPTGSSLKFLIIAKGEAHVYPRLGPTMEWDTGAAQAILEAAGGAVINEETGQPLAYNKENLLNPHFIAYGHLQAE